MKSNVLDNVGDLFNELYYIYKDKYNEEKDGLNAKKQKASLLQKTETYWWLSMRVWRRKRTTDEPSKKSDRKEPLKKLTKDNASNFNEWVNINETGKNSELFQKHFKCQRPRDMLKLCTPQMIKRKTVS